MSSGDDNDNLNIPTLQAHTGILHVSPLEQLEKENRQNVIASLTPGEFGHILMQYHQLLLHGNQLVNFHHAMKLKYNSKNEQVPLFIMRRKDLEECLESERKKARHEAIADTVVKSKAIINEAIKIQEQETAQWRQLCLEARTELEALKAEIAAQTDTSFLEGLVDDGFGDGNDLDLEF